MNEVFVPNLKHCPRCNFRTDNQFIEDCLNCRTKLWPVSYEKYAKEMHKLVDQQFEAIKKQTNELHQSRVAEADAIEEKNELLDVMREARTYVSDLFAKRSEDVLVHAICERLLRMLDR